MLCQLTWGGNTNIKVRILSHYDPYLPNSHPHLPSFPHLPKKLPIVLKSLTLQLFHKNELYSMQKIKVGSEIGLEDNTLDADCMLLVNLNKIFTFQI